MWIANLFKKLFGSKDKNGKDFPGCLPPLTDYRNVLGSSLLQETPLPENYRTPYYMKVKDQNGKPFCVTYSATLSKEEKELKEGNDFEGDADWLYQECKKIDNYPGEGTYLNMPFKVMLKKGIKPLNGTETEADKYRIGGYIQLDDLSHTGLKRAIYQWGIIIAGYSYSRAGWATEYVRPPKIGEATTGHAVAPIGWEKILLLEQNSFGKDWGKEGMFYVPENYRPFAAFAILTDLPNNWRDLLPSENDKPKCVFNNNLWFGTFDNEISKLQDCLKWIGCMDKNQESTGYFGGITLTAVKLFQQRYGIQPISGYVGPLTRQKLNELFQ